MRDLSEDKASSDAPSPRGTTRADGLRKQEDLVQPLNAQAFPSGPDSLATFAAADGAGIVPAQTGRSTARHVQSVQ